ncbi:MAG: hypothetical protein WCC69_15695 [Pirellulales bacterium]
MNRSHARLQRCPLAKAARSMQPSFTIACGVWLLAVSTGFPALAEGLGGLAELGPMPTGLAASAFLNSLPARPPTGSVDRDAVAVIVKPPVSWRPLSPSERLLSDPVNVDLFPHTRRAVPLLVPDAIQVTSQTPSPARLMSGPSVGVRWRIPGYAP